MSLTLVKFGQEVDVATGSLDVAYFAIFQAANGLTLKLPLSEEASQTLIGFYATAQSPKEKVAVEEPQEEVAEETWAEQEERLNSIPHSLPSELEQDATTFGDEDQPDNEEEIPSL